MKSLTVLAVLLLLPAIGHAQCMSTKILVFSDDLKYVAQPKKSEPGTILVWSPNSAFKKELALPGKDVQLMDLLFLKTGKLIGVFVKGAEFGPSSLVYTEWDPKDDSLKTYQMPTVINPVVSYTSSCSTVSENESAVITSVQAFGSYNYVQGFDIQSGKSLLTEKIGLHQIAQLSSDNKSLLYSTSTGSGSTYFSSQDFSSGRLNFDTKISTLYSQWWPCYTINSSKKASWLSNGLLAIQSNGEELTLINPNSGALIPDQFKLPAYDHPLVYFDWNSTATLRLAVSDRIPAIFTDNYSKTALQGIESSEGSDKWIIGGKISGDEGTVALGTVKGAVQLFSAKTGAALTEMVCPSR